MTRIPPIPPPAHPPGRISGADRRSGPDPFRPAAPAGPPQASASGGPIAARDAAWGGPIPGQGADFGGPIPAEAAASGGLIPAPAALGGPGAGLEADPDEAGRREGLLERLRRSGFAPGAAGHFSDDGPPGGPGPGGGPADGPAGGRADRGAPLDLQGPADWTMEELTALMIWGREQGMSDLVLTTDDRPWLRLGGAWRSFSERRCRLGETARLLERLTRNEAAPAMVLGGVELDFGCEVKKGRYGRLRFRGNASAVANGWTAGLSLTLRALPDLPPDLEALGVEPELSRALFPDNGLVLVTGVMGSGKSTLLAAALRRLAERSRRHIATYESPVEFDLAGLPDRLGPVEQSEIPRHIGSFAAAARNVTRRAADVVLIGESRDPQTLRSLIEAAEIGVAAYTTVHTRGVAATPQRILGVFPRGERSAMRAALISALRVVVQQRLYPRVGGGRLAVREWLVLDQDMRDHLQRQPIGRIGRAVAALVAERGRTLEDSVRLEVARGRLSSAVLAAVEDERRRKDA